jgi:NAD+ diphosphatase
VTDDPVFSGSPLDRAGPLRTDDAWIARPRANEKTRYLALWRLEPMLKAPEPGADAPVQGLAWAKWMLFEDLDPKPEPLLLGVVDDVAHFAVDVSFLEKPVAALGVEDAASFADLRGVAAALPAGEAGIAAHARALVDWHRRHPHCAECGARTRPVFGGAQRNCIECSAQHFPRTDPVVIAPVVQGDRCLLGRSRGWPERMYSALAGFVEPGETLEEAVRREVAEESGVRVGAVRYVASQPWPFPSSLMIGCIAEAESTDVVVDRTELDDARWFDREVVRAALAGTSDALVLPPPIAIAHQLIRTWADAA